MSQFETVNGSRKVITTVCGARYESRLYVDRGNVATLTCAKHTTEAGAIRWARKILGV